jgi:hypothetical protein
MKKIAERLGVTELQVQMAYYSGALPPTIDPEPYIKHWEQKLADRRARIKPKTSIYDETFR